jgi:hypothetical protein
MDDQVAIQIAHVTWPNDSCIRAASGQGIPNLKTGRMTLEKELKEFHEYHKKVRLCSSRTGAPPGISFFGNS